MSTLTSGAAAAIGSAGASSAAAPPPYRTITPIGPEKIKELAALLPAAPRGFGPPCRGKERAAWDALRTHPAFQNVVSNGEKLLTTPFPAWSDDDFLEFSRNGQRPKGQAMIGARHGVLAPLVWAECLENTGRFVPRIETVLRDLAGERTWTLPAHDPKLTSFKGTEYIVDLGAALFANDLAQTLYLLDGVISPTVRKTVMDSLEKMVFAPIRTTLQTGKGHWWLTTTNNWNAVCLNGVTNAALAVVPTREERAVFVGMAERYARNTIDGFAEDGYCSEGMGYYNYGFGNFYVLREGLWQATSGKIDLFATPKMRKIATYGPRLEIMNAAWPAIADCRFETKVDPAILGYCSKALGLGLAAYEKDYASPGTLVRGCMTTFPNSTTAGASKPMSGAKEPPVGSRSYFDAAGILVLRPAAGSSVRLGAALKGGNNDEHHNHNDIGSFTLVVGKEQLVGDPGGPYVYTSKTFGSERYTAFKIFASYGHPVPVLAGKQQRPGKAAAARILRTDFTDTADTFVMDIAAAYPPGTVEKYVRTFRYDRTGVGTLTIEDEFSFPKGAAQPFETALTTHADWKASSPNSFTFTKNGESLIATVETPEGAGGFTTASEVIEEDCLPFTRLGLRLNQPVAGGRITITFRPGTSSPKV
ncbi:MAG: heparinase II/III family protein [Armatimonadota bacterium]